LYFVSFYVFNLHFRKSTVKTLLFLQKFAFNIEGKLRDQFGMRCQRACFTLMEKLTSKTSKRNSDKQVTAASKPAS
jgi:hypothetical protein